MQKEGYNTGRSRKYVNYNTDYRGSTIESGHMHNIAYIQIHNAGVCGRQNNILYVLDVLHKDYLRSIQEDYPL